MSTGGLPGFSEATRAWFTAAFAAPTQAQAQAWQSIGAGDHTLVIAPTGSGKTLAAFLWAIDKLATEPVPANPRHRCRVLYISPMKALAVDVERNLRSPLTGVRRAARRLGLPEPDITVAVRTGDTAADERRKMSSKPPDILITTPESLFLLLTSQARESLRGVETVIVDEVHALAGGKRGAHLALSLERLDALRMSAQATAAPARGAQLGERRRRGRPGASRPSGSGCRRPSGRPRKSPRSSAERCRSRSSRRPARSGWTCRSSSRSRTWPTCRRPRARPRGRPTAMAAGRRAGTRPGSTPSGRTSRRGCWT